MKPKFSSLFFLILSLLFLSAPSFGLQFFQNSGFETGDFSFWNAVGIVDVITGDSYVNSAYEGNYMALISIPGTPPDYSGGGYRDDNYIKQTIEAFNGYISFWFNFFTTDYDYDNPGFVVKINDTEVFSLNANDDSLQEFNDPIYSSGWRQFQYDISSYIGDIELAIYAGNTDNNDFNSWVYIDGFSPNAPQNPSPAPIPEPATVILLGLGLGIFTLFKRIKKNKA